MLSNILKLDGAQVLSKTEQRFVNGGQGNCMILCNSGNNIENAPNGSQEVQEHACQNQGGPRGFICAGEEQPWIR